MKIDYNSVEQKVQAWAQSPAGKKKINQKINEYKRKNVERTEAGSVVLTDWRLRWLADQLVTMIRNYATSSDIPASVSSHFTSLRRGRLQKGPDGSRSIEINFGDDLSRESLQPQTYGGVNNIIAIFNNGYPSDAGRSAAISHVTGVWHGVEIHALGYRPGLHFMQQAVADFNAAYGAQYGVTVELAEVYES